VDNSLSKTINFPETATEQDVAVAYQLAWKLGCKGITVYVTGSREKVVLETQATVKKKQSEKPAKTVAQPALWQDAKKPRPRTLSGFTYSVETPLGKAFITINENGDRQPFEVFINTAKAGSETAAVSEAIGRLISYVLRLMSPIEPATRLREVFRQLSGIGGGRSLGFGPNRVRSLPDGLAQVLGEYLEQRQERMKEQPAEATQENDGHEQPLSLLEISSASEEVWHKIGDLCPECGQATVVNEEGCRKCYTCGYSEC
jgi:ribonucleoside-diphosphate reductase alpha chain